MKHAITTNYIWFAILFTLLLASACTTATPVSVVPSATVPRPTTSATSAPAATATPTVKPSPVAATPSPSGTIKPTRPADTPTPNGEVTWAEGIQVQQGDNILSDGAWSPTTDEIIYFKMAPQNGNDIVLMHFAAPDFQPKKIRAAAPGSPGTSEPCFFPSLLWSRDGQRIFFSGPVVNPAKMRMESCSIWMVEHDGRNPRLYQPEQYGRWLSPDGWLDDHTLILTGYREGISLFDLFTGKTINWAYPSHFGVSLYTRDYFVGTSGYSGINQMYALGRRNGPVDINEANNMKYALTPPPDNIYNVEGRTILYDTLPGTNKVLGYWSQEILDTRDPNKRKPFPVLKLVLWDIDQNSLSTLVPYGFWGHFSPDKRNLAYLTDGPAGLDAKNKPLDPNSVNPSDLYSIDTNNAYLQMLNLSTGSVFLSVPVVSRGDIDYQNFLHVGANFSADGQFLSFTADREIAFDDKGWPKMTQPTAPARTGRHLYVLDLKNRRLVWEQREVASILYGLEYTSKLDSYLAMWSPKSNQFIYLDAGNNPVLVNLSTGAQTPLTLKVSGMPYVSWSASGKYVAVQIQTSDPWKIGFVKIP